MNFKAVYTFTLVCFCWVTIYAQAIVPQEIAGYYGSSFINEYSSQKLKNKELLLQLFAITSTGHHAVGYETAKDIMFGKLFLSQVLTGEYSVKEVYCLKNFTDQDYAGVKTIGPMLSPRDGNVLNTEHTWPQSKFSSRFLKSFQKADLHHLFPTDSQMNNYRGNLEFGVVKTMKKELKCPSVKLGFAEGAGLKSEPVFEVPNEHKGNVARAMFYFATRYKLKISSAQEAAFRAWNNQDPVDAGEQTRNNLIFEEQGNRNPFVDLPSLVDQIDQFNYTLN